VRITGGEFKGREIFFPKTQDIRPTSDFIREAMFQIITNYLNRIEKNWEETKILDLCSGTGALGIEAMSRGAKDVVFVDISNISLETILKNLKNLGFSEYSTILRYDLRKDGEGLKRLLTEKKSENIKFDLILADPPYMAGLSDKIIEIVAENDFLDADGVFILEDFRKNPHKERYIAKNAKILICYDVRNYGQTRVSFYGFEDNP